MRRKRKGRKKAPQRKNFGSRRFDHQLIELKKNLDELSTLLRRKNK